MEIIKKAIFGIMGYILLIMFISYGIETLLFSQGATYLTSTTYTTSYGYTFTKYTWDYIAYARNLESKVYWENIALHLDVGHLIRSFGLIQINPNITGWDVATIGLTWIAKFMLGIANLAIFVLNILFVIPIQLLIVLLYYVNSLLGLNMADGTWWMSQAFNWINANFYIPMLY